MRLALVSDPCYQTGYNGSNGFLLYRKGARVFVTQVLNGYYSRVDSSVDIDFATLNGRQIIQIETTNTMPPSFVNYYFEINPVTNMAVPAKLFRDGKKLTNQLYSAMLLGDMKDFSLPESARELAVIRNHHLAPTFSAYEEDERGTIDSNGSRMRRIIYRWNGHVYSRAR